MSKTYTVGNLNLNTSDILESALESVEDHMPVGTEWSAKYCADTGTLVIEVTQGNMSAEDLADLQEELQMMPMAFE
jgi:hypothetical protein